MNTIKYSLAFATCWFGIYKLISYLSNEKKQIVSNTVSSIHATTTVSLSSYNYFFRNYYGANQLMYGISAGYFIYDLINEFFKEKRDIIVRLGYMSHHLISLNLLYLLNSNPKYHKYYFIYGLIELSNLPGYIVYHSIKKKYSKSIIKNYKLMQAIIYSTVRVSVMGFYGYLYTKKCLEDKDNSNDIMIYSYWSLYSLGVYWSFKLWRNLLDN